MGGITERHVQAIWYDAALRPPRLYTRRGSEVSVVSPGEWNLGAGPDFLGAVIEIGRERKRVVGDVEIHICPSDWDLHGHGADPKYQNVVAHVTWGCGPVPASLPPSAVSIWLGRFVAGDSSFSPDQIDLSAYPYARLPLDERPCRRRLAEDPDFAIEVLRSAGRHRLRMKARRICGRLGEASANCREGMGGGSGDAVKALGRRRRQVFYEEVMTALGYSRNTAQFRHVAEHVPIDDLPRETDAARAALLVAGGFEEWNRVGLRPWNQPERRLSDAAAVFTSTSMMDLAEATDFTVAACRDMVAAMRGGRAEGSSCMGRGRAAAILANVVVPYAIAEERVAEPPAWLPPEDISQPVRLTAFRLFGRDHNPAAVYATNGLLIQGLLQIHRDLCLRLHPDCDDCALGSPPGLGVRMADFLRDGD